MQPNIHQAIQKKDKNVCQSEGLWLVTIVLCCPHVAKIHAICCCCSYGNSLQLPGAGGEPDEANNRAEDLRGAQRNKHEQLLLQVGICVLYI